MDSLRLAVEPVPADSGGGFQVLIFVNGVEMTAVSAGLGMDPYHVLIPRNTFLPGSEPHTFGVARCSCGSYGCGATDVTIISDGGAVVWEWSMEAPVNHPSRFKRHAYLREVQRIADDHSWETPDRTAGRLILDLELLRTYGLTPSWVGYDWRDSSLFEICFVFEHAYQIFLRFPWDGDNSDRLEEGRTRPTRSRTA